MTIKVVNASYIKFSEKLIREAKEEFHKKFASDNNQPLRVRNVAELSNTLLLKFLEIMQERQL